MKAFPRYISATHSLCEDIEKRKILLENLQDEENRDGDHPKLWRDFAFALGSKKEEVESAKKEKSQNDAKEDDRDPREDHQSEHTHKTKQSKKSSKSNHL